MRGLLLFTFLFLVGIINAQQEESFFQKVSTSILLGYQIGGQGENRNFVTKNGSSFLLNAQYKINNFIHIGPGIGIVHLEQENFFPTFLALKAKFKEEQNSQFMRVRLGYSFAENSDIAQLESYDFDGGFYFTTGWGYQWKILTNMLLDIELNVEFQKASLEFTSFSGATFDDNIQNYFLSFKTGISF